MAGEHDATTIATPTRTRTAIWWALLLIGVLAAIESLGPTYLTYATNDYRPILKKGVWASAIAILAFLGTTLAARRWRARIPGIVGSLLVLPIVAQLLERLAAIERSMP